MAHVLWHVPAGGLLRSCSWWAAWVIPCWSRLAKRFRSCPVAEPCSHHVCKLGQCSVHLWQFLTALVTGRSLKLWNNDSLTLLWNSFFGYYWILLCVADAMAKSANKWHDRLFSATTTKNMLQMRSQKCMRCMRWPSEVPFVLRAQQEECAELHFAVIKTPFAGVPCVRDAVLSTHHHHLAMAANQAKRTVA